MDVIDLKIVLKLDFYGRNFALPLFSPFENHLKKFRILTLFIANLDWSLKHKHLKKVGKVIRKQTFVVQK